MTRKATEREQAPEGARPYDYTRLAALTFMPEADLKAIFDEDILPQSIASRPARAELFVRLCMVRLLRSGIDPEIVPLAAELLSSLFEHSHPVSAESWLLLFGGKREIVTQRAYMIDAVARAKAEAIVVLDLAEAWRVSA